MRELLLAYLFGQLDSDQRQQVERALADEPELQEELRQLRSCLGAVDPLESVDPPPGLVERTCRRIIGYRPATAGPGCRDRDYQPEPRPVATESFSGSFRGMSPAVATTASGSHQRCSRGDFAVTVGLAVAAAMFLFPALLESRMLARRSACQENMRELSLGISLYANSHGGNIPHVPAEGPEAFAGIFAVRLAEGHFVDRRELGRLLICPGTIRVGNHERDALFVGFRVPTQEELFTSPNEELAAWKRKLGGDFAYRVGYMSKSGRYCRWRNDRSPRSAILADAPSLGHEAFQSANHGGDGQNVLFADGHVGYLCQCPALACGDHLYKNRAGYRAAAIGTEDNVLVRSEEGPALQLIRALGPR